MMPVEQRHMAVFDENGDNTQRGDCLTACVASLFELAIEDVPFFVESDSWWQDYQDFARERGLCIERAWVKVDEDDPMKLNGWPGDRYWIATVKSPRGKTRCSVCKGTGATSEQWNKELEEYVALDCEQPCDYCAATGLVPSLHALVMFGRDIVWDPHPQRDMGHLGFISGEQFGAPDPARLTLRRRS